MSIAIPDFVEIPGTLVKVNAQEDEWRKALEAQQARLIAEELERLGAIILPDDMTLRDVGQLRRRIRQLLPQLAGAVEWLLVKATELGVTVAVSELAAAGVGLSVDRLQVDAAADNWHKQWNAELTPLIVANTERAAQQQLAKFHAGEQDINALRMGLAYWFSRQRADNIATTETTRGFAKASELAYRDAGIRAWQFLTANDDRVCPICAPLGGLAWTEEGAQPVSKRTQEARGERSAVGQPFVHPGGVERAGRYTGQPFSLPAHTRCRCRVVPVL